MRINLPVNNFSFFKTISGLLFLLGVLFFPVSAIYSYMIGAVVGRAHGVGAWVGMWRGGRLTKKYIIWMAVVTGIWTYLGLKFISMHNLFFITSLLFIFHFIYDEFDLQETKRSITSVISSLSPTILILLFLVKDFLHLNMSVNIFVIVLLVLLALELIYIKEIDWFFVQTKILTIFIFLAFLFSFKATSIVFVFLVYHYFFWFIYPVYKLHKYKREERDGFIMILILLFLSSLYGAFSLFSVNVNSDVYELGLRIFLTTTIIHIFSTAPFGYFFGLSKPKYH